MAHCSPIQPKAARLNITEGTGKWKRARAILLVWGQLGVCPSYVQCCKGRSGGDSRADSRANACCHILPRSRQVIQEEQGQIKHVETC